MSFDEYVCTTHGWLAHTVMHETGHATAAVLLGFPFEHVTIAPAHETHAAMMGGAAAVAAGVTMTSDQPEDWIGPRSDDALTFLAAGTVAEELFLTHVIPGGDDGDILMYRRGMKLIDPIPPHDLNAVWKRGQASAEKLIRANDKAFLSVYKTIVERVPQDGHGAHFGFDEPLIVSSDDVRKAVASAA